MALDKGEGFGWPVKSQVQFATRPYPRIIEKLLFNISDK
jgi:hypothetical protein